MNRVWLVIIALLLPTLSQSQDTNLREDSNPYLNLDSYFEFLNTGDPLEDWNSTREWSDTDGRTIKAKILGIQDGNGRFLIDGNNIVPIPLSRLSAVDQRFIAEWREISRFFNLGFQKSRNVSNTIEAGIGDGAFAKEGKVHETRHFRFESDKTINANTVKDFSRMFEATYTTVKALPLGLELTRPGNGKFLVRLFSNKADYYRAGGNANSSGTYILSSREILVPFESLGLKLAGNTYRIAGESDSSTLVHEITHAVVHHWLNYLPMWVAEGFADYVAAIPYKNGAFFLDQHAEGLYKMVALNFGGDALRCRILQPHEFVYLDSHEYMNRAPEIETPVDLAIVNPWQIQILGNQRPGAIGPVKKSPTSVAATTMITETDPPIRNNPTTIVVQRYSSSMLLLHYLISSGQVEGLRKYLFANLHFDWDNEKYIADYNRVFDDHQTAVRKQVEAFNKVLKTYNETVVSYNRIIKLRKEGKDLELPPIPENPVPPEALTVPKILAEPRSSESFSIKQFRQTAVKKYFQLPEHLSP